MSSNRDVWSGTGEKGTNSVLMRRFPASKIDSSLSCQSNRKSGRPVDENRLRPRANSSTKNTGKQG
eukprot:3663607-Rhodomonas_salina.1